MDHSPHFLHQHARRVPVLPHNPRHPQFPQDPNFQNPRPHHCPPPSAPALQTPPPPPPLSYRTIHTPLPPRPYNPPHQSQFVFNTPYYGHHPVEDDRPVSADQHHGFSHPLSHKLPVFGNPENRYGVCNPPKVLAYNRLSSPYPPLVFDRESPQHSFDRKLRYDSECRSRLRIDGIDGHEANVRENIVWSRGDEIYHRRGDFASNNDTSSGDFGILSGQCTSSRGVDSKSGGYVHLSGLERGNEISRGNRRDGRGESKRWINDRKAPRGLHDLSLELDTNDIDAGASDSVRFMSGKREYYGSELGRYNNRGNREGAHELIRTPKKQIQKKSALLRIQTFKPNYRNREIEQLHYTGYSDDSNSNSLRGKEQLEYSGYDMKPGEREGSPVELDISFKSNSLVAKAIVSSSSSAIVSGTDMAAYSDTDLIPIQKKEKVMVTDGDSSDLQSPKLSNGAVSLTKSPCIVSDTSSSGKDLNLQKNVSSGHSHTQHTQTCSNAAHNSQGKNEMVQSPKGTVSGGITNICSSNASSRVAKKKKIVKRVVKKVVLNSNSLMSSSLSASTHDRTVQEDNATVNPSFACSSDKIETSMKEKITTDGKLPMLECLQSYKGNLLPENEKEDVSLLSVHSRSQECSTDEDSHKGEIARIERSGNISISPSHTSSNKDKKSDSECLDAVNFHGVLQSLPNTGKVTNSLHGSVFSDINDVRDVKEQFYQNEVSVSASNVGYSENRHHAGDVVNCRLWNSVDNVISTDLNTSNFSDDRVSGFSSNDLMNNLLEKITVCDRDKEGIVFKAYCKIKVPTINTILEENPETSISVPSHGSLSLGEMRNQNGPECLKNARAHKQDSDNGSTNSDDNITVSHCGIMHDFGKQVSMSYENFTTENFPNFKISDGFGEEDTNKINKRKVRNHLDLSSSMLEDVSSETLNPISLPYVVDTALSLSLKDQIPSEVSNSAIQRLDFSFFSVEGVTVLNGKKRVSEDNVVGGNNGNDSGNGTLLVSERMKARASQPNFTPFRAEFSDAIVVTKSCAEVPVGICDNQEHQKEGVAESRMAILSVAPSIHYPEDTSKLPDHNLVGGSFGPMNAIRENVSSECLELQHPSIGSRLILEDMVIQNVKSASYPMLEAKEQENATLIVPTNNSQNDILDIRNFTGEKMDVQAEEEIVSPIETPQCKTSSELQFRDFVQRSLSADMGCHDLTVEDDLPLEKMYPSSPAEGDGVTANSNSGDELVGAIPDVQSDMHYPGAALEEPDRKISDCQAIYAENSSGDEENLDSKSIVEHGSDLPASTSSTHHIVKNLKSDVHNNPIMGKILPESLQVSSKVSTLGLNSSSSELNGGKNQPDSVTSRTFQSHSSRIFSASKASTSSTHVSTLQTWHRTVANSPASLPASKPASGSLPPKRPISVKKGNLQNTSYIRKGNSLVRKPTPTAALPQVSPVNQLPSLGLDESRKSNRSERRIDVTDQPNLLKTGVINDPLERQRTPKLPIDTKSPNSAATSLEDNRLSPLVEPLFYGCPEGALYAGKFPEINDMPNSVEDVLKCSGIPENQTGPSNDGESQIEGNDGNLSPLNTNRIVYVKRKSNQLVATSSSCDLSVSADDNAQTSSSGGDYKRSKDQLVITAFEGQINQTAAMPNRTVKSDGQGACKVLCNRRFSKRRSHKTSGRSCNPLRVSLAWTLCGTKSIKKDRESAFREKVLPHWFPWKRATYLRSFVHNLAVSSNSSSSYAIRKLLLLRKRNTVYTKSTCGFSLWKSKVLGVAGSSLKWSKSIERRSKKASEEATLSVAAVERKKREQKDAASISSGAKRERIFRIGSIRYRMDPSRRTLQRISDDESFSSASTEPGPDGKRTYIPRRLVIGNNEYVRIGNGSQLIRDPKKRTRMLANEKIRWSLHTARQRLARKKQYCQFFSRFGKCNKDGGKCPYIHDPSKIAVCTKFLNGLCSTPNCKLTHKVIPERMPDCSYFLQGLCTNRNCPYRHVNVNPKASICEQFLRGYCAHGNECRKKHSYVCPTFEATGTCAQGNKCKLHHPKTPSKGKKGKRSEERNCKGRYFGSIPIDLSEPGMMVAPPRQCEQSSDNLEGELSDYISLDVVEEELAESIGQAYKRAKFCDSDSMDLHLDDVDELIKPVRIMKENFLALSSPL
ncbi:hypothetical protein L6164_030435 [Bauhinia variegata]|uniref:Uncharacterized protein n=1 Tax=Bauhinia variegata TaxID=167791 RepID=A0ACB9LBP1_BAUVA|nr:hypothetical protein L6164_030435 [Bauhinia variegata]